MWKCLSWTFSTSPVQVPPQAEQIIAIKWDDDRLNYVGDTIICNHVWYVLATGIPLEMTSDEQHVYMYKIAQILHFIFDHIIFALKIQRKQFWR